MNNHENNYEDYEKGIKKKNIERFENFTSSTNQNEIRDSTKKKTFSLRKNIDSYIIRESRKTKSYQMKTNDEEFKNVKTIRENLLSNDDKIVEEALCSLCYNTGSLLPFSIIE